MINFLSDFQSTFSTPTKPHIIPHEMYAKREIVLYLAYKLFFDKI